MAAGSWPFSFARSRISASSFKWPSRDSRAFSSAAFRSSATLSLILLSASSSLALTCIVASFILVALYARLYASLALPVSTVPGNGAVDDSGVDSSDIPVAKAQARHRSGRQVLDHDV